MWLPNLNARLRVLAAAALLALAAAQAPAQKARPGTVHVIEFEKISAADFAWLRHHDFAIDTCSLPALRVYATPEEADQIAARGIAHHIVETQPTWPRYDGKALGQYHSYDTMTARLQATATAHPAITRLYNLGNSVQGRALWAMLITSDPDSPGDKPDFKYVSTMHGDEVIGTELCLYFIDTLVTQYGAQSTEGRRVTRLVDNTAIWIVPLMNPDGHVSGSRFNANGVDLNRNFPSLVRDGATGNIFDGGPLLDTGREPETRHIMRWTVENSFVLSANMHGGALVVNYPFDEDYGAMPGVYAACPDDALFIELSKRYSMHNPPMWASTRWPFGITNGAAWYTLNGGMQDWHYRYVSCKEVTLELSSQKRPAQSTIPTFWTNNKESMFHYLEAIHTGVRGIVTDAATGDPVYARITVDGNDQPVYSNPDRGNYHRLLLPGVYTLRADAPGLPEAVVHGVAVGTGAATRLDIALGADPAEGEGAAEGEGMAEGEGEGDTEPRYALTLTTAGSGLGTAGYSPTQETFAPGQTVLLLAAPGPGSRFSGWQGTNAAELQPDAVSANALLVMDGDKQIEAVFEPAPVEGETEGDGEGVPGPAHSSADVDQDYRLSLGELLRVVQLYNSPGFGCMPGSEDGFAPGGDERDCAPHTADYNPRDWDINLSELLRVIQLYHAGGYHPCASGEDGFCPGL